MSHDCRFNETHRVLDKSIYKWIILNAMFTKRTVGFLYGEQSQNGNVKATGLHLFVD